MVLKKLGILIGTGNCNANCNHCAGKQLRKYSPRYDGEIDDRLILKTLSECYIKGARSLSISGTGEPTLSPKTVTKTLQIADEIKNKGYCYEKINLYTNGIRIGKDKEFSKNYLKLWKGQGLNYL